MRVRVATGKRAARILQGLVEPVVQVPAVRQRAALDDPRLVDPMQEETRARLRLLRLVDNSHRARRADHQRRAPAGHAARTEVGAGAVEKRRIPAVDRLHPRSPVGARRRARACRAAPRPRSASRGRAGPSQKRSRYPQERLVRAAVRRGSRRTRRSGARRGKPPALPAPARRASPASSSYGSDSPYVHARPRCRDGAGAGRPRRRSACRASRGSASAAARPVESKQAVPERRRSCCVIGPQSPVACSRTSRTSSTMRTGSFSPGNHAERGHPRPPRPSKTCARTEDVPTSSARIRGTTRR